MNPQNKELFIFNYLEDNLSISEKELADDLYVTDEAFKKDVDLFKLSYYQQSDAKVVMSNNMMLYPKSNFKYYASALSIVAIVTAFFFIKALKTENQALLNQIESYHSILSSINNKPKTKDVDNSTSVFKKENIKVKEVLSESKIKAKRKTLNVEAPKESISEELTAFYSPINYEQSEDLKVGGGFIVPIEEESLNSSKERVVRKLTLMQKINNARVKMKYNKHKEKTELATWQEIKDAFKTQSVVPMK
jgi:stress response protein YsnF